jgi:hypothetical protein
LSLRQIQLSDLQVNACGVYTTPQGIKILPLPWTLPGYTSLLADQAPYPDFEIGTHPEFPFVVRQISYTGLTAGTLIQVQWPDGKYLQNTPVDFFSFCGTGKRARYLERPKLVPPQSKIRLNLDNSAVGSNSDVEIYFEGCLLIPLVNG